MIMWTICNWYVVEILCRKKNASPFILWKPDSISIKLNPIIGWWWWMENYRATDLLLPCPSVSLFLNVFIFCRLSMYLIQNPKMVSRKPYITVKMFRMMFIIPSWNKPMKCISYFLIHFNHLMKYNLIWFIWKRKYVNFIQRYQYGSTYKFAEIFNIIHNNIITF